MQANNPLTRAVALVASLAAISAHVAVAADAPQGSVPRATICYSNNMSPKAGEQTVIGCQGLGKFSSLHELYERGFRVVSSGFVPDPRVGMSPFTQTMYFLVEERK